jgi:hypothetical protein
MVGVQTLGVFCLTTWGILSTCIILWVSHQIWTMVWQIVGYRISYCKTISTVSAYMTLEALDI